MRRLFRALIYRLVRLWYLGLFGIKGPPRILTYSPRLNRDILRRFGAKVGRNNVRLHSPIILHEAKNGYHNLAIGDGCILNGNNFLDLSARITLEDGVSLGPGVVIMTHNRYNYNAFLERELAHTCGKKDVLIKEGAGLKANVLVIMGIKIGRNAVIAGGAVVNRDVPDNTFAAGVPARLIKVIGAQDNTQPLSGEQA